MLMLPFATEQLSGLWEFFSFALEVVHRDHVVPAGHDELVGGGGSGRTPDPGGAAPSAADCRRRRSVHPPRDVNVVDTRDLSDGGDDGAAVTVVDAHDAAVRPAGHDEVLSFGRVETLKVGEIGVQYSGHQFCRHFRYQLHVYFSPRYCAQVR